MKNVSWILFFIVIILSSDLSAQAKKKSIKSAAIEVFGITCQATIKDNDNVLGLNGTSYKIEKDGITIFKSIMEDYATETQFLNAAKKLSKLWTPNYPDSQKESAWEKSWDGKQCHVTLSNLYSKQNKKDNTVVYTWLNTGWSGIDGDVHSNADWLRAVYSAHLEP